MLLDSFYTIESISEEDGQINAILSLNGSHEVFDGHFPGNPVVPGVIQLQMVKEVMEHITDQRLLLTKVNQAKYLHMIKPDNGAEIEIIIHYQRKEELVYNIRSSINHGGVTVTKLKASLQTGI